MNAPTPSPRPNVSSAASCLSVIVAFGALVTVCCIGGATLMLRGTSAREASVVEEHLDALRESDRRLAEAEALLDEVVQRLEADYDVQRVYPAALPEAPPPDPWGTELRYEPGGNDRAWLRSAGPDGAFDTADDLVRTLAGR